MANKIDWTKPIEYTCNDKWIPARLVARRKATDGYPNVILYDLGAYEATSSVSDDSTLVRNVPEMKRGYAIVTLGTDGVLRSYTGQGTGCGLAVGSYYALGRVVHVSEFEYTA